LIARGHAASIATSPTYRPKIEREDIGFDPIRPDLDDFGPFPEVARRVYDPRRGAEYIVRTLLMPRLADTLADLEAATQHTDLLLTHPLTYAAHLLARATGIRWLSTVLSPMVFVSSYDPPILPPAPWLKSLFRVSPPLYRLVFRALRAAARGWSEPVRTLARQRGWPAPAGDPLFEGQYSPYGTLGMFSSLLAAPQPDWPAHTTMTGFALHDGDERAHADHERLEAFLACGEAPIVFTLGSSAIYDAGDFFRQSLEIAARLERRAVLLTGAVPENTQLPGLSPDVLAIDYAPYSGLFPRAASIVHQGGVGTLAQGLHAGRPMLVVPFSHDQPDNAERAERLGVARVLPRRRFTVAAACAELRRLLDEPRYSRRAAEVRTALAREDGVAAACDRIEATLAGAVRP
jgi:UDP:flavonoid glycosyltransferase YjiC (YdhE family)